MRAELRFYELLLRSYPADFRQKYEREMLLVFGDMRRHRRSSAVRFWVNAIWDVMQTAPVQRLDTLKMQMICDPYSAENVTMRMTMAILTTMIGAMEAVNAMQEVWLGSGFNHDPSLVQVRTRLTTLISHYCLNSK